MTSPLPPAPCLLLVLAAMALPGCMAANNDRHVLGTSVRIETVDPTDRGQPVLLPADGPSVSSADRSNWLRTEYLVPLDGTYHYPQYTFLPETPTETDRQRGIAPAPLGALQIDGTNVPQAGEAIADPFVAAAELICMIPRMFIDPPWVAIRSPGQWPYQRARSEYDPPDAVPEANP